MQASSSFDLAHHSVVSIVETVDHDVERGEDTLMLGYSAVLMSPFFAPIAPPHILLPLMTLCFILSVCSARRNFQGIQQKLTTAIATLEDRELWVLRPIMDIFKEHPKHTLTESFNPIKNPMRTLNSFVGGLFMNPYWMPIFYTLGMQFVEDKQFYLLNKAVISAEHKIKYLGFDS